MLTRHVSRQLAAHLDGRLTPPKARQVELHLGQCPRCRAELDQIRHGMESLEHLPKVEAPAGVWFAIEAAIEKKRAHPAPRVLAWAAAAVLVLAALAYWRFAQPSGTRWEVVRIDGAPSVDAKPIHGVGRIGPGEWIETDARSRATVKVGDIGSVEVEPATRLRVVAARPSEHRFALARGEIRASVSAPPRLFFVDTKSGTAVDLGCEYALTADEAGFGVLHVTRGWVSFAWKGRESLVPAGASCKLRPEAGPGIPYFDDASETLKQAIDSFGLEKQDGSLDSILAESRVRDTLSLWHLLSRVDPAGRERVYDRMAHLTPVPAGVSREQALRLDPQTLQRWKDELAWKW